MKKLLGFVIGSAVLMAGILPSGLATPAQASHSPRIVVESLGRSEFRIQITDAASLSSVDLFNHQSDSELWNGILNIGYTNSSGNFTTTRRFNSFHPELQWYWYASVGGRNTPAITSGPSTGSGSSHSSRGRVLSNATYNNGTLVNDNGTVYIIYRDQKIGFASASIFERLDFDWDDVISGSTSGIPLIYVVTSGTRAHPWGSWIKLGRTTYFVHEDGLIPVESTEILRDNGGRTQWVVSGNNNDERLRKLSKMRSDDSRLD